MDDPPSELLALKLQLRWRFKTSHDLKALLAACLLTFSAATLIGAAVLHYSSDEDVAQGASIGVLVTSVAFSLGAASNRRKSGDELSRTIWFFNRQFAVP